MSFLRSGDITRSCWPCIQRQGKCLDGEPRAVLLKIKTTVLQNGSHFALIFLSIVDIHTDDMTVAKCIMMACQFVKVCDLPSCFASKDICPMFLGWFYYGHGDMDMKHHCHHLLHFPRRCVSTGMSCGRASSELRQVAAAFIRRLFSSPNQDLIGDSAKIFKHVKINATGLSAL